MILIKKIPNKDDDNKNITSGQWIKNQIDMRQQNNWSQERHHHELTAISYDHVRQLFMTGKFVSHQQIDEPIILMNEKKDHCY
jgi:hypothetical protein